MNSINIHVLCVVENVTLLLYVQTKSCIVIKKQYEIKSQDDTLYIKARECEFLSSMLHLEPMQKPKVDRA